MKLSISIIIIMFISVIMIQITLGESFAQRNNHTNFVSDPVHTLQTTKINILKNNQNDISPPIVNITYPPYPPTITSGKIIIEGTANDSGSGIQNVSALAYMFTIKGISLIEAVKPVPKSNNNWSLWYLPLLINTTGTYRVVIIATDNAGNPSYAQTTINALLFETIASNTTVKNMKPTIAMVRPTFTEGAYSNHGFYDFYFKYGFPPFGKNITSDLDMLSVKVPRLVSEFRGFYTYAPPITSLVTINGNALKDILYNDFPNSQKFWIPFIDRIKKGAPNSTVTVIRDEDVHDGHIFYKDNKTNAYDVLLLSHNEYVTQQEYDNLRQFVKNGGTIVFIDPDILYAEVSYDRNNHTITLVKGHNWEFDGKAARRSVSERWYNETKEWVGGNYLVNDIKENITFANNPFNYTHFEEQFVNNPEAKIIIDYDIKFPKNYVEVQSKKNELPVDRKLQDITVATYTLDYGKGKIVMLGLYGQNLVKNNDFMNFFDNVILPDALCPTFQSCIIEK